MKKREDARKGKDSRENIKEGVRKSTRKREEEKECMRESRGEKIMGEGEGPGERM